MGHILIVREIVSRKPGFAIELNQDGYGPLHLASLMGHLEVVQDLICIGKEICLLKDKFGLTSLHSAAMMGRLQVMRTLLDACPESIMVVTARRETPIHIAVIYNQCKAVQILVEWLLQRSKLELVNAKDRSGNTLLHLATSRKQFQTVETLLASNPTVKAAVEVNATNAGGFTALDIFDVLPPSEEMDMEIDKILRRAGALQARYISRSTPHNNGDEIIINFKNMHKQPSHDPIIKSSENLKQQTSNAYTTVLLLAAAILVATITFYAALCPPGKVVGEGEGEGYEYHPSNKSSTLQLEKQNIIPTDMFIFNSAGFFTSMAMIIYLTNELPMKLCPLISMSSLLGSYMCLITAISPNVQLNPFFLASPAMLLAAARVFPVFCSLSLKYLPWKCTRNLGIY